MTLTHETSTDTRLGTIEAQLAVLVAEAEERRRWRESFTEFTSDLSPVARQAMVSLTDSLADVDSRGYIEFARGGAQVLDKVVTSFSKEDVDALGDNVILILETIREMTQPEILQMLRSTLLQSSDVDEALEPPRLLALISRLRRPAARRGLHRLIMLVESLGAIQSVDAREERGLMTEPGPEERTHIDEPGNDRRP